MTNSRLAPISDYPRYWAEAYGIAEYLPMSLPEMEHLGWDSCDIVLVTGDAYVDHPSFGMALIGRLLEAQGYRVGIIAQPDWRSADAFKALGRPNLYFAVTSGNMDSMVNRYTSDRKLRHDDAYTPDDVGGMRPDRAVIVYAQRCREAFKDVPVILGGIEASLRRTAHYDYWSDKVRRSVLLDAKADLLLFGNAERAIVEVSQRIARGDQPGPAMYDIRGIACKSAVLPDKDLNIIDYSNPDSSAAISMEGGVKVLRVPSYEQVRDNPLHYAHASRILHRETNPGNARGLVQAHGNQNLWLSPPPLPLTTAELDWVYELPFQRQPHPVYRGRKLRAYEMIRFSVNIMRGCFGGCTFCSITEHEGRIIQNRSSKSILNEIEKIRDKTPGYTGTISDLGGPTANMWRLGCQVPEIEAHCRRPSCVYPGICSNLTTDHQPLIDLYRNARRLDGVKRVFIASGLRYDLAIRAPEYVEELVRHHVGGYLKVAPEHTESGPLGKMMKPGSESFERFNVLFKRFSKQAGKNQYLIPYFIAAHPGTTDLDMLELALWLKKRQYRVDQVQAFLPSPMSTATAMYHTGINPLAPVNRSPHVVKTVKGDHARRLHKAYLRYHDPANWPLLRASLHKLGRSDLIGKGPHQLVPATDTEHIITARQARTQHTH